MDNIIYALIDPRNEEVRYIGKSTQGLKRPRQHKNPYQLRHEKHTYKTRWIKQLLNLGLTYKIRIIQSYLTSDYLSEAEKFWISLFIKRGCRLTNITEGGEGVSGYVPGPEAIDKLIKSHHGLSGEKIPKAIQMYKEGLSIANIAKILGVSTMTVRSTLIRQNITRRLAGRHNRFNLEQEKTIVREYLNGKSSLALGRLHRVSNQTVINILKRSGVSPRILKNTRFRSAQKNRKSEAGPLISPVSLNCHSENSIHYSNDHAPT